MNTTELAIHYVCTHDKAEAIIEEHDAFWVSNCGCRESHDGCARSRLDVCLIFTPFDPGSGTSKSPISRQEVTNILQEARDKQLVARPYRDETLINRDWGFNLSEIQPHIDIWHGEMDVNVPVEAARYLQATLPNPSLHILPSEGHFFLLKRWEQILSIN